MRSNHKSVQKFRAVVRNHYRREGRHTLPWRVFPRSLPAGRRAYRIVVSEFMLQQTQVARVLKFYPKFLKRFPTFRALARASRWEVLTYWQGLGYNRRAVSLHRLAEEVVTRHRGKLPNDPRELQNLPGLGPATVGAVLAFAFDIPTSFIETNIRRVFLHHFFPRARKVREEAVMELVHRALPKRHAREWYSALMDYGSWLAKRTKNTNRRHAIYRAQPQFKGSSRELRGKILRYVLAHPRASARTLAQKLQEPRSRVRVTFTALKREGIL